MSLRSLRSEHRKDIMQVCTWVQVDAASRCGCSILVSWMVIVIMVMVITYNDNDDHVNIRIRMQRRDALGFGLMLRRDAVVLADMMQLRVSRMRPRYPIDLQLQQFC